MICNSLTGRSRQEGRVVVQGRPVVNGKVFRSAFPNQTHIVQPSWQGSQRYLLIASLCTCMTVYRQRCCVL